MPDGPTQHTLANSFRGESTRPATHAAKSADTPSASNPSASHRSTHSKKREAAGWILTALAAVAVIALIKWWGLSLNAVATDSMMPTYKPTDLVVTISPERTDVGVGSPIVFETEFGGEHIPPHVHRIIENTGPGAWRTQGDNSEAADPWTVRDAGIKGVVIASVPGQLVRSPLLLGSIIFITIIAAFWPRGASQNAEDSELPDGPGRTAA